VQYTGLESGYVIGYDGRDLPADQVWPGANLAFFVLEVMFGFIFTFEVIAKICAYRKEFVRIAWNWVDTIIVIVWAFQFAGYRHEEASVNPMMLRIFRLARLLRVFRLMHTFSLFGSLHLLITSVKASMWVLFWTIIILFILQAAVAMFLVELLDVYMHDPQYPVESRQATWAYFGTFTRAMVTMFEVTLANWAPACRLLTNNVSEAYGPFFCPLQARGGLCHRQGHHRRLPP